MAVFGRGFPFPRRLHPALILGVGSSVIVSGTATAGITKADIIAGSKTIILTLNNDNWVAAGGTFDGQRQNIINGLTSAQSETFGWNNTVKALQGVAGVVRTSATVVTITLDAQATYNITATETVTVTVPSTALIGGIARVATPTFTVAPAAATVKHRRTFIPLGARIGSRQVA